MALIAMAKGVTLSGPLIGVGSLTINEKVSSSTVSIHSYGSKRGA